MRKSWLAALSLSAALFPAVSHANLTTGDVAFVDFASRSTVVDQWGVVFLAAPSAGETISFTTDDWGTTSFTNAEDTVEWVAPSGVQPGYVLQVNNSGPVSAQFQLLDNTGTPVAAANAGSFVFPKPEGADGEILGVKAGGDNITVYEGAFSSSPSTFLTAISTKNKHFSGDAGNLPTGLVTTGNNRNALDFSGSGGYYKIGKTVGNEAVLRLLLNTSSNWQALSDVSNTDLPYQEALYQPYSGLTSGYRFAVGAGFSVPTAVTTATPVATWTPVATATPYGTAGGSSLSPGDVQFVGVAGQGGTYADQLAVVLTTNISQHTVLTFTDYNWSNTTGKFNTTENIVQWVADGNYPAGDVIQLLNSNPYTANVYKADGSGSLDTTNGNGHGFVASVDATGALSNGGSNFGLDKNGDNLFVVNGVLVYPTATPGATPVATPIPPKFVAGLTYEGAWGTWGDLPNGAHGEPALTNGTNAFTLSTTSPSDNSSGTYDPANGHTGAQINNVANWTNKAATSDTDLPVPVPATGRAWPW
ncbi:MAG TPA: hypothetical protein VMU88_07725 [bacterium]|nr:hypothetical protein [bacterium]